MVARKPRRLVQLRRGRNGENRCDNKAYHQDRRKRAAVRGVKAGRRLIGEMDLVISTYCMEWIKINSNLILNPG